MADKSSSDEFMSFDDELESAYREALQRMDDAEWQIAQAFTELQQDAGSEEPASDQGTFEDGLSNDSNEQVQDHAGTIEQTAAELLAEDPEVSESGQPDDIRLHPRQIVEAILFVGGEPLTTRRICSVLKREFDHEYVERRITELNEKYAEQNRPYHVSFGEGGYRMQLRNDHEEIRNRVFGIGPREIRLSQEILEILSQVAYRQPVSQSEIEAVGKSSPGPTLRQLLRRDLIKLDRGDGDEEVRYRTTDRFLEVFGLATIEELPVTEDLDFK